MPIPIDEFESGEGARSETNAERVVRFLVRNRDKAYRATEIASETGVAENSIHPVLNRLKDQGLVRHRPPYWAIGDLDAVREAAAFSGIVEFLDDELGEGRRSEWLDAAEDDDA